MVIGCSFSDRHINDAITEAAQKGTLTGMFLVDPAGWEVLNRTPPHHIKVPNALEEVPRLGGSTRLFSATFAGCLGTFARASAAPKSTSSSNSRFATKTRTMSPQRA
jgi:hypothetical protein